MKISSDIFYQTTLLSSLWHCFVFLRLKKNIYFSLPTDCKVKSCLLGSHNEAAVCLSTTWREVAGAETRAENNLVCVISLISAQLVRYRQFVTGVGVLYTHSTYPRAADGGSRWGLARPEMQSQKSRKQGNGERGRGDRRVTCTLNKRHQRAHKSARLSRRWWSHRKTWDSADACFSSHQLCASWTVAQTKLDAAVRPGLPHTLSHRPNTGNAEHKDGDGEWHNQKNRFHLSWKHWGIFVFTLGELQFSTSSLKRLLLFSLPLTSASGSGTMDIRDNGEHWNGMKAEMSSFWNPTGSKISFPSTLPAWNWALQPRLNLSTSHDLVKFKVTDAPSWLRLLNHLQH